MVDDLTPLFDWAVVLDLNVVPLIDAAAMRELFMRVGAPPDAAAKAEATAFKLSELGKAFALDLWQESKPSASREQLEAEKLASALGAVLSITGVGTDAEPLPDGLLPSFGPGGLFASAAMRGEPQGKAATMNALRAVYLLRLDALAMAGLRRRRAALKPPKRGRPESVAENRLVAGIAAVYFDVWGKVPTVHRSKANATSGDPSGTFVSLMVEVVAALRARGVVIAATAEALQKRWSKLPPEDRMRLDMAINRERST